MRAALLLVVALLAPGCLKAWDTGGPWACSEGLCPQGYTCDDGVCCVPGGAPACPTLPTEGQCPGGAAVVLLVRDADGDGAGDEATRRPFCSAPRQERWVADGGDCDDGQASISPSAPERCNAIDDDCDGVVDDGLRLTTFFRDEDDDGFGVATDAKEACVAPPGYVASAGDCAPLDPNTFPGAPERCNGNDDNCNGQPDDAPFVDVENPGQAGPTFDCQTGRPGVCAPGGVQCLFQDDAGFRPVCVPRQAPSPDVCGNNVDEDCSGAADDRPGCGGPANLLATPGVSFGAFTVVPPGGLATLPTTCLKGASGATGMGWLNPSWVSSGVGAEVHVWWAEAPVGETWDVSTMTTLHLAMRTSPINNNLTLGTWGTTRFPNAVVALCGPAGDALRYRPSGAAVITGSTSPFFIDVPLRPPSGSPWTVTGTPATTLPRVQRVEVWMSPEPVGDGTTTTFTNRLLVDAGVPGFR